MMRQELAASGQEKSPSKAQPPEVWSGCQNVDFPVNQAQVEAGEGLEAELSRLIGELRGNLKRGQVGSKEVLDDYLRGRLVSLLGMGLSLRQAGAMLGLSHEGIRKELKRNPELAQDVTAARFQAQVEPLLVIVRESRRSWRAATWLVKHLQERIKDREETPDETRQRVLQEQEDQSRRTAEEIRRRREEQDERIRQQLEAESWARYPGVRKPQSGGRKAKGTNSAGESAPNETERRSRG